MAGVEREPSDDLLDLIFPALDVGVETVRATNGGMDPFLMTPGDGKPAYTRFVGDSMQRCIELAQQAAEDLPAGVPAFAIAIDGYLPTDEEKFDAVIVEAAAGKRGRGKGDAARLTTICQSNCVPFSPNPPDRCEGTS